MNSKETMAMIGRQWSQISEQEKQAWQYRAEQLKHAESAASIEEEGLPEPPGAENEDWRSQKKPARKQSDKSDGESATV